MLSVVVNLYNSVKYMRFIANACPLQYTETFKIVKKKKKKKKKSVDFFFHIFLIFAQNIDCGYTLNSVPFVSDGFLSKNISLDKRTFVY